MIPHLPVQKVSLRHPQDRITNNMPRNTTRYTIGYNVEQIISKNWNISSESIPQIDWNIFSRTMRSYPRFKKIYL